MKELWCLSPFLLGLVSDMIDKQLYHSNEAINLMVAGFIAQLGPSLLGNMQSRLIKSWRKLKSQVAYDVNIMELTKFIIISLFSFIFSLVSLRIRRSKKVKISRKTKTTESDCP